MNDADEGWEKVMPFVVCKSQGGPYDDDSFVAGFELGRLDAQLPMYAALGFGSLSRLAHAETLPQVELVTMRYGYRVRYVSEEQDGWVTVDLDRVEDE